ncbi:retinol dehydrogenase 12 [Aspergillus fijiensis CBS 313.89]|uniref:Retinol dehydrogenase 12 n=1 Tax=Aspergillus fijiensis CBS 313.89 TaxID=1448319 RepID=A0A8G1VUJ1_9EURO|nr:retinol dehydrogenase 12 [Aspergillus fijiensis CBS 313.89]RAK73485.1 retinol dehydrogenase 12 [Aspergillus fijiensis CBS 313.89]
MQTIKNTIAENFGGPSHELAEHKFSLEEVPDLSDKVAVVTGGSEGIGFGCTHTLLSKNIAKLFVTSLRKEVADEALAAIEEEFGPEKRKRFIWLQCDLSDWEQTAHVAGEIASQTDRIDILINNAARGIMSRQLAPTNGIDQHMATNHMGHVVLTSHLLPTLKKTADAGHPVRIVNLSSNVHSSAPADTEFASVEELNREYDPNALYGRSKLANLLHAKWLNQHLQSTHPNIIVNATHPGVVDTAQTNVHIHDAFPLLGYGMSIGLKPFRKTQFQGAVSTMYAATVATEGGQFICPPCIVEKGSDKANDMQLADRLMKLTAEVVEKKTRSESSAKGCPFKED